MTKQNRYKLFRHLVKILKMIFKISILALEIIRRILDLLNK